jgi:hypothetical protein
VSPHTHDDVGWDESECKGSMRGRDCAATTAA